MPLVARVSTTPTATKTSSYRSQRIARPAASAHAPRSRLRSPPLRRRARTTRCPALSRRVWRCCGRSECASARSGVGIAGVVRHRTTTRVRFCCAEAFFPLNFCVLTSVDLPTLFRLVLSKSSRYFYLAECAARSPCRLLKRCSHCGRQVKKMCAKPHEALLGCGLGPCGRLTTPKNVFVILYSSV